MTEAESSLVRDCEPAALAELDEDDLLDLHGRVRRARTKYVGLYRRGAATSVAEHGGRGKAHATNQRNRDKAEVFETVLARVSKRVDVVARAAAAELRDERIQAAREAKASGPAVEPAAAPAPKARTKRTAAKTTGGLKRDASSKAQGARRQAKRDAR